MFQKIIPYVQYLLDNLFFAFFASIVTFLLRPQESAIKSIKVAVATTIIGTLVGLSVQTIPILIPFRFAIVTLIGFYGKELYEYFSIKLKNPTSFWRELRGRRADADDSEAQTSNKNEK